MPPNSWGAPAGVRNDSPVSLLDLYPTIADVCGLTPDAGIEGKSLTPILRKPDSIRENPAIVTIGRGTHAVVERNWRYIRWFDGSEELYDLRSDPDEFFNLAGDPAYEEEQKRLAVFLPSDSRFKRFARAGRYKGVENADGTVMVFDFEAPGGISEQTDIAEERPDIAAKFRQRWLTTTARHSDFGDFDEPRNSVWSRLPDLPPGSDQKSQPGLAGPFAGVLDGALVIAGGANFPDGFPWEGGAKVWHDDVFILEPGDQQWRHDPSWQLPAATAYGGAVETDDGLLLIGGLENGTPADSVWLMRRNAEGEVEYEELPALPTPVGDAGTARSENRVFVVGGASESRPVSDSVFEFDLESREWSELPPLPGPPRRQPVVTCQDRDGRAGLYVFSGSTVAEEGALALLSDAWFFDFGSKEWQQLLDIEIGNREPGETNALTAAAALPWGADGVLVFSGSGSDFLRGRLELLNESIRARAAGDEARADELARQQMALMAEQPTFRTGVHLYTPEHGWRKAGDLPKPGTVTTRAFVWEGGIVLPTGEIRPGVRTPRVLWAQEPSNIVSPSRSN